MYEEYLTTVFFSKPQPNQFSQDFKPQVQGAYVALNIILILIGLGILSFKISSNVIHLNQALGNTSQLNRKVSAKM